MKRGESASQIILRGGVYNARFKLLKKPFKTLFTA